MSEPALPRRKAGRPPKSAAPAIEAAKSRWLAEFAVHGWAHACEQAGVSIGTPSNWRRCDAEFAEKLDALDVEIADTYERIADEAIRGKRQIDRSAMTLLIFRLKALRPAKYRERSSIEHTGAGGGAIKIDGGDASRGASMLREWGARFHARATD